MTYAPHTISCGCCANGCACRMHDRNGFARICAFHDNKPHPQITAGNYSRYPDALHDAMAHGVPVTLIA